MFDCLVAGDANVDLLVDGVIALEPGTEKLASNLNLVLGGSSAITAFNLSRLGAKVAFAGVIGYDLFGRFVEEKLLSAGVDIELLRRTDTEKTGVTIWHSRQGERAGVTYSGAIAMLEVGDVPDHALKSARHFHVGAYFLQSKCHAGAPKLFARAKALGLTTSVDCNYDPGEFWDSNLRAVLEHTDLFFPNEDEARAITRTSNAAEAARELAAVAKVVIVKRGSLGALIATRERQFEVPAIPAEVVDATGAGDSFNAGFLSRFILSQSMQGEDLEACAQAGALAASRSVGKVGGTAAFED
jgi:sugar/nucleoside kinase (ribokinase family)